MRHREILRAIIFFISPVLTHVSAYAADPTLTEIQAQLQDQEVTILGDVFTSPPLEGKMVEWHNEVGDGENGGYRTADFPNQYAPSIIRGQKGKVIGVVLAPNVLAPQNAGGTDVFGKPVSSGSIRNPYFTVLVQMETDGSLVGATGYYSTIMGKSLKLASDAASGNSEVQGVLNNLVGRTVYKNGMTKLYSASLSKEDLSNYTQRELSRDISVANLTPLKITDAKVIDDINAVVIRVELPDGDARIMYGDMQFLSNSSRKDMLDNLSIFFSEKYPSNLPPKELAAIKNGSIYRGMPELGLYLSWGFPSKTNDYGAGGQQFIYGDGLFVYVKGEHVTDWQDVGN